MSEQGGRNAANPNRANPNILAAAMIFGAVLTAGIGTMVPSLAGMIGPEATWIRLLFYAVAATEVILALWLRARMIKAQRPPAKSGGTIQRQ